MTHLGSSNLFPKRGSPSGKVHNSGMFVGSETTVRLRINPTTSLPRERQLQLVTSLTLNHSLHTITSNMQFTTGFLVTVFGLAATAAAVPQGVFHVNKGSDSASNSNSNSNSASASASNSNSHSDSQSDSYYCGPLSALTCCHGDYNQGSFYYGPGCYGNLGKSGPDSQRRTATPFACHVEIVPLTAPVR